ncbi:hypothetical protein SDC9_170267 [bioreactor metagenome]|uniref:Uncharacterized protein n=1 Tax=bioreactor metagenome TaxID=1076179 RepID=A0A645GA83_9ZZZZ
MGYSVCYIYNFTWSVFIEIFENCFFKYFRVKISHAVYTVTAPYAQVCHVYFSIAEYGHLEGLVSISQIVGSLIHETTIYFCNYHVNSWKLHLDYVVFKCFQRFRKYSMVCVGNTIYNHFPRFIP